MFEQHKALIARVAPFAAFILVMVAESLVVKIEHLNFDLRWLYALRSGLALVCVLVFWKHYTELKSVDSNKVIDWLLSLGVGVGVFFIWINLTQSWATLGEAKAYNPYRMGSKDIDWLLLSFRITGSALVVPLIEELFWRSFLMRWIENPKFTTIKAAQVSVRAIVISSIIFALEHHLVLAGFIAGVAYAWLYVRTGNLWMAITAHAITNGVLGIWVIQTGQWQFW